MLSNEQLALTFELYNGDFNLVSAMGPASNVSVITGTMQILLKNQNHLIIF